MGPVHVMSAYDKERPADGSLAFPWRPTTMLSLAPNIEEAKEIALDPHVQCLHKLTGDRRTMQPKGPYNLATDYYLVPKFESMVEREAQITHYVLRKEGICLVQKKGLVHSSAGKNTCAQDGDFDGYDLDNEESWSDDGFSADRGLKKKRFQWKKRVKPLQKMKSSLKREIISQTISKRLPLQHLGPSELHVVLTGGVDPRFKPSIGDIILAPPKRQVPNLRMPHGTCVMTFREYDQDFKFKDGDLAMCLGRYVQAPTKRCKNQRDWPSGPSNLYDPFASVTLYRYTSEGTWRLMGCHQKDELHWVPESYDHLYSSGKNLTIGTRCPYGMVVPKLGDIIIKQGAWDENFDHHNNYRRSLIKWWTPRFQFRHGITPGTVLIRPFIDRERCMWESKQESKHESHVYWGRAEMYIYTGQHAKLGWKYWGTDKHIHCTPFEPPKNVLHYVEDTDVDIGGLETEFQYRHELREVRGDPCTFVDVRRSGYPL